MRVHEANILVKTFRLIREYQSLYDAYLVRGVSPELNPADTENNFDLNWKYQHYFDAGSDALRLVTTTLLQNLREPPASILDFPSGSGRVTRHFQSFFPSARVVACDLYDYHVDFCVKTLGAEGFLSKENFDEIEFGQRFDVIFSGSLLTHLPEDLFMSALRLMCRSLSEKGIALITLGGRHAEFVQRNQYKVIEDDRYEVVEADAHKTGFGYSDYNDHLMSDYWYKQKRYGFSLSRPHWVLKNLEQQYDIRFLGYIERGFDYKQDVLIVGKPGVNED